MLEDAAHRIKAIPSKCPDSCCASQELMLSFDGVARGAPRAKARELLLAALARPLDPGVEGVALEVLGNVGDLRDLATIEARFDDRRPAWQRSELVRTGRLSCAAVLLVALTWVGKVLRRSPEPVQLEPCHSVLRLQLCSACESPTASRGWFCPNLSGSIRWGVRR